MDVEKINKALDIQGAVNPRAVANLLRDWLIEEEVTFETTPSLQIRLVLGQLNWLLGNGLGPSMADLDEAHEVRRNAKA